MAASELLLFGFRSISFINSHHQPGRRGLRLYHELATIVVILGDLHCVVKIGCIDRERLSDMFLDGDGELPHTAEGIVQFSAGSRVRNLPDGGTITAMLQQKRTVGQFLNR